MATVSRTASAPDIEGPTMTPAFAHYDRIVALKPEDRAHLKCLSSVPDDFLSNRPSIPKGTIIRVDFGYPDGVYGRYDRDGVITSCQIHMEHFGSLRFVKVKEEDDAT